MRRAAFRVSRSTLPGPAPTSTTRPGRRRRRACRLRTAAGRPGSACARSVVHRSAAAASARRLKSGPRSAASWYGSLKSRKAPRAPRHRFAVLQLEGVEAAARQVEHLVPQDVADGAQFARPAVALAQQPCGRIAPAVGERREVDGHQLDPVEQVGDRFGTFIRFEPDSDRRSRRQQGFAVRRPLFKRQDEAAPPAASAASFWATSASNVVQRSSIGPVRSIKVGIDALLERLQTEAVDDVDEAFVRHVAPLQVDVDQPARRRPPLRRGQPRGR